jgi:hypothetical protein
MRRLYGTIKDELYMATYVVSAVASADLSDQLAILTIVATMLTVIFILARLKLLVKLLIIFFAMTVFFAVMTVVPALRVPVIYDIMQQFFIELPEWIGGLFELLRRMTGGIPT